MKELSWRKRKQLFHIREQVFQFGETSNKEGGVPVSEEKSVQRRKNSYGKILQFVKENMFIEA
jgi:hypothetical protein